MTEQLTLTPAQALALTTGSVTVLMKMEQPPEGYEYVTLFQDANFPDGCALFKDQSSIKDCCIELTHPVGSTVKLTKEWRVVLYGPNMKTLCESKGSEGKNRAEVRSIDTWQKAESMTTWQPASTMPDELIIKATVTACEVVKVQNIDALTMWDSGIRPVAPSGINCAEYPEGFEKWNSGRRDSWFKAQARGVYISQLSHEENIIKEFMTQFDTEHGPGAWELNEYICLETVEVK